MPDDQSGSKLTLEQQALVEEHRWLVAVIARDMAPKLGKHLDPEDLLSAGHDGLVQAALAFDVPVLHDKRAFARFARYRIKGAMIDEYKREAQNEARVLKLAQQAGYRYLERQRRRGDVRTDRDGQAAERLLDFVGGLQGSIFSAAEGADLPADPEEALDRRERRARGRAEMERCLKKLKPNEARVLREHHLDGRPLSQIGRDMKLQHPAVYRIHDEAAKRLHALLDVEGVTALPPRDDEL